MGSVQVVVDRLYRMPRLGRLFRILGSVARISEWRDSHSSLLAIHAVRLDEQARLTSEVARQFEMARAAAAARESALVTRLDGLGQLLETQGAFVSAVQQLAHDELSRTRAALDGANLLRKDFERYLPEVLNAATLQEATVNALREELAAARRESEASQQRLQEEHRAAIESWRAVAAEVSAMRGQLEGVSLTARRLDATDTRLRALADETQAGKSELARAARRLEETETRLEALGRETAAKLHEQVEAGRQLAVSVREELWKRAGAIEHELSKRGRQVDESQARIEAIAAMAGRIDQLARDVNDLSSRPVQDPAVVALRDELWARAGALEAEVTRRALQLDQAQASVAALAGDVHGSQSPARLAGLEAAVRQLTERVEFVRRETLFEVRYGQREAIVPKALEPRLVNAEKVKKAARALKVNVGCGHITYDDYVNVDRRELPGVDVVAEAVHMPFAPRSLSELYSAHLLEHFPQEELRRAVLPYWKSLLKPGGRLRAVVPDAEAMIREFAAGSYSYDELREVTFGGQDYEGDFHYNMFTPDSLAALLREAGFKKVEVPVKGRRNGACFEFEVVAS